MWLFTKHGFYSVVCARQGDGSHGQSVDPDRIMVRARVRSHLEALKQRFDDLLADCEIKEFAGTDYAYRIFVPKSVWSQVVVGLNEEMDYDTSSRRSLATKGAMEPTTSIRCTRSGR